MAHEPTELFIAGDRRAEHSESRSEPTTPLPVFSGFLPPVSNTTFTPNQFFDVCLPHCSRSAIRLVGYFLRRTLGWCDQFGQPQEEQIEISFRELALKSGVSASRLRVALDEAVAAHFIECVREGRPKMAHDAGQSALFRLCWHGSETYHKNPADFRGFYESEGNRTDIPNQFFDHIIPTEPLSVIKVVGSIIRSSIGFQAQRGARRQWTSLSYSQIQNFTRLRSRKELASSLRTALARNYIVRLQKGNFTHEKADQRSAVYALRWADGWSGNQIGMKSLPEKPAEDRSETPTSIAPKTLPEDRADIPTSIKTKLLNEMEKQQQADSAGFEILRKEGFSEAIAGELAKSVAVEVIQMQIEWLPLRSPARSRLGMLRRAMEQNWPEPAKVRTSGLTDGSAPPQTRELVRHFYAGYHANGGEPVAEPSVTECELAKPLAERLLRAGAKPDTLSEWGRRLGQLAREQHSPVPSFPLALRQVGDRLCAEAEDTLRRRGFVEREMERVAHRNHLMPQYLKFISEQDRKLRIELPGDYVRFETKRSAERTRLNGEMSPWRTKLIAEFDSEPIRLRSLQAFFQLPDFWQWDSTQNSYPFNPQS